MSFSKRLPLRKLTLRIAGDNSTLTNGYEHQYYKQPPQLKVPTHESCTRAAKEHDEMHYDSDLHLTYSQLKEEARKEKCAHDSKIRAVLY